MRRHSCTRLLAAFAMLVATARGAWSNDSDVKAQLFEAIDRYAQQWQQGFIEARVESVAGPADVSLWWDQQDWRLDYVTYRSDGEAVEPTWNIFVVSGEQFCRYSPLSDSYSEGSRQALPDVRRRVQLRVHPMESWFELSRERSLKNWLSQDAGNQQSVVIARPEGGFSAFIGRPEQLDAYRRAAALGPISDVALDDGHVFHLVFDTHGLLTRIRTIGTPPPGSGIDVECEWTADSFPMPKRLVRRFQSAGSNNYYTHLKIEVERVGKRLPPDAPSLQIPTEDLPLRDAAGGPGAPDE